MRVIDAHHHLWSIATAGHQWPSAADGFIHRDFGPSDFAAASQDVPLAKAVLIQSQPTDQDTDWLLATARDSQQIAAVVGWVDLASPDAPDRIASLARCHKLRGLRPMLQSIADTDWLLREELAPALTAMQSHGLRFDALVQPRHLPMLARFADRWPDLALVIDHGAKPYVARGDLDPWREQITALAARGLYCKLSGLRTEQAPGQSHDALRPYVDHLVKCFGERLMWGSDWPVLLLAGDDYAQWYRDADRLAGLSGDARESLFHGAARSFYDLTD